MTHEPRPDAQPGDALPPELDSLRHALLAPPSEDVAARHLAAITTAAREAAHLVPSREPAPSTGTWGLRLRRALGLTGAKVALTASAALAATGGLAATGSLPDPAQRVIAEAAERVGIHIPAPDDDADVPAGTPADDGAGDQRDADRPGDGDTEVPAGDPLNDVDAPASENADDDTPPADGDLPEEAEPGTDEAEPRVPDKAPPSNPPADTPAEDGPSDTPDDRTDAGSDGSPEGEPSGTEPGSPDGDASPGDRPPSDGDDHAGGPPDESAASPVRTGGT